MNHLPQQRSDLVFLEMHVIFTKKFVEHTNFSQLFWILSLTGNMKHRKYQFGLEKLETLFIGGQLVCLMTLKKIAVWFLDQEIVKNGRIYQLPGE